MNTSSLACKRRRISFFSIWEKRLDLRLQATTVSLWRRAISTVREWSLVLQFWQRGWYSNSTIVTSPLHVVKCFAVTRFVLSPRHFVFDKMPKAVCSKTYTTPRRPFEKERLNQELKIIGEYGLRNKREVWRVKYTLAKIRKAARELLTLEEKDPKRLFEGNALLRRLVRIGVLDENRMKLDYVLGLRIEDFLERRLQTQVFKLGLAKSIHHARVLIRQRHIR